MNSTAKGFLIFIGVLVALALFFIGMLYAISSVVTSTAEQAFSPVTQANDKLQTRVAQVLNPTPTVIPDPATIIHEVRSLARLETIQYTLEKVITAEKGQNELGFLFGEKMIFVGHGQVIAGVDMAKMQPQDMWTQGNVLYVRLPAAEVFVTRLDNEKSYVYNRDTGLLTKGDVNLEKTVRVAAEKEILKAAVDDGIVAQAQQNAEGYLSRMLRGLGYKDVVFVQATPVPGLTPTLSP